MTLGRSWSQVRIRDLDVVDVHAGCLEHISSGHPRSVRPRRRARTSSVECGRDGRTAPACLRRQIAIATAHSQSVRISNSGDTHDLDAKVKGLSHAPNEDQLLVVLLPE